MSVREYVGARYVPIVVGEWDNTRTYEPLMVVIHEGNSYVSRQYVPTGIDIQNEQYWIESANYNAQVDAYRKEVQAFDGRITANANSIATEKNERKQAVANEASRATSAEQALQTSIDAITPFDTTPTANSIKGVTSGGIYTAINGNPANTLYGKKVAVYGDSTTQYADTGDNWPTMLANRYGCIVTNRGINGTTITPSNTTDDSIYNKVIGSTDLANFDYIIICGGTNDLQLGKSLYSNNHNVYWGIYDTLIEMFTFIQTKAPTAQIVMVGPFYAWNTWLECKCNGTYGFTTYESIIQCIKQACYAMHVPFVDAFHGYSVSITNSDTNLQAGSNMVKVHPNIAYRTSFVNTFVSAMNRPVYPLQGVEVVPSYAWVGTQAVVQTNEMPYWMRFGNALKITQTINAQTPTMYFDNSMQPITVAGAMTVQRGEGFAYLYFHNSDTNENVKLSSYYITDQPNSTFAVTIMASDVIIRANGYLYITSDNTDFECTINSPTVIYGYWGMGENIVNSIAPYNNGLYDESKTICYITQDITPHGAHIYGTIRITSALNQGEVYTLGKTVIPPRSVINQVADTYNDTVVVKTNSLVSLQKDGTLKLIVNENINPGTDILVNIPYQTVYIS